LNSVVKSRIRWPLKAALSPGVQPIKRRQQQFLLLFIFALDILDFFFLNLYLYGVSCPVVTCDWDSICL
jgi:hypothetical protein